jgi:hypothetical protein
MIAYRIQEKAFVGLDRELVKLLDRLVRGEKPNELSRRLKPGTVLVREYKGNCAEKKDEPRHGVRYRMMPGLALR